MGRFRYALVLAAVMLAAAVGSSWGQDRPAPLFEPAPAPAQGIGEDGPWPRRAVTVNSALLQGTAAEGTFPDNAVQIELFDGARYVAQAERIDRPAAGLVIWQGRIEGQPEGSVTLAARDGVVAGTIWADGRLARLSYAGDGLHLLEEMPGEEPMAEHPPIPIAAESERPAGHESGQALNADDGSTIDVLVVYTPASRVRYGGPAGVEALINLAVAETNTAFERSLINTRLSLVATAEVSYVESGAMLDDLYRLKNQGDGYMDEVHTWRDEAAADTVTLIQEASDYCGIAFLMTTLSQSFQSHAFSVVDSDCAAGYYSFGHELGHNMGSAHNRANAGSSLYDYSFGYWAPDYSFRTIMAYNCPGGCGRLQNFSNPNVLYNGQPTGIAYSSNPATAADNALSINQASYTVANWRDSATRRPGAPSGLAAVAQSHSQIDLSWRDNSSGEIGFEVQRRIAGQSWSTATNVGANVTSYQDQGLAADTAYEYRVRGYTDSDYSDFSNTAGAVTPRKPELHVGQLYGGGGVESGNGPGNYVWQAKVTVLAHDAYHQPAGGATVNGQWSGGASGGGSCVTDGSGTCSVTKGGLGPAVGSVTFSVSSISNGGDEYLPDHNHDPDGDGSIITVFKPVGTVFLPWVGVDS